MKFYETTYGASHGNSGFFVTGNTVKKFDCKHSPMAIINSSQEELDTELIDGGVKERLIDTLHPDFKNFLLSSPKEGVYNVDFSFQKELSAE